DFCFFLAKSTRGTDAYGIAVKTQGTALDQYLDDVVGRPAGLKYQRVDFAAGGVSAHADAIETAVRAFGRVPIRVEWEPPGSGAHAMLISEVIYRPDGSGGKTRLFKIFDPEGGKAVFVTDAELASRSVVQRIPEL